MDRNEFVDAVIEIARRRQHKIEINRENLRQIDFGNKKLHEEHLRKLYPVLLKDHVNFSQEIEKVAPGRPCTHKPIREIVESLKLRMIASTLE